MAAAINAPVSLMETAGEGGAWGIALLASYMLNKKENQPLDAFLSEEVFHGETGVRMEPNAEDVAGFDAFIQRYKECLPVERAVNVARKIYECPTRRSDFVDGPNSAGPHYTFST